MRVRCCYNCGEMSRTFYAEENGYALVKCDGCGLLYLNERPDDDQISQAHKQGEHHQMDITGKFIPSRIEHFQRILDDIFGSDLPDGKSWLDVGCGHGEFMVAIQEYSGGRIVPYGTEPNVRKREAARARGLRVSYFDLESHSEKYDMISLLNVYSHLPDPPALIHSLKKLLKPGGELLIETGDTAELGPHEQCRPFYLPEHISFASERILVDMLQRLGFEIVGIRKYPLLVPTPGRLLKETVKLFLPHYRSGLQSYLHYQRYNQADMFLRARYRR